MPTVAGWIDDLRAAFGAETINAAIRAGLDGQPTFYAEENGRAVGTKSQGMGSPLPRRRSARWRPRRKPQGQK